jgi:AraC-like DNA-binding protein
MVKSLSKDIFLEVGRMNDRDTFKLELLREAHKGPTIRVDREGGSLRDQQYDTRMATTNRSYQRVGGLVVVPDLLREMGGDPAVILSRAGVETSALDHVENRIPYLSMGRLFHECAFATSCPHFGLSVGQRIGLLHLGIPGAVIRHSATLRAGLQRFLVYQHLDNQGHATFLSEGEGTVSLGYAIYQRGAEFIDQMYDTFLATACNVMRELWGSRWAPEEVQFSRTTPADLGAYRRFFRAPCRFDRERTAIFFSTALLNRPMPEANPEQLRRLEQEALIFGKDELLSRLRRALRIMLLSGRSSAQEVAALLFLHRRTLNRRLRDQGTHFQQILDEIRFEAACQLLDNTRLPLTGIAASLGYSESSAFTRAFRRWCGVAPSRRRRTELRSSLSA